MPQRRHGRKTPAGRGRHRTGTQGCPKAADIKHGSIICKPGSTHAPNKQAQSAKTREFRASSRSPLTNRAWILAQYPQAPSRHRRLGWRSVPLGSWLRLGMTAINWNLTPISYHCEFVALAAHLGTRLGNWGQIPIISLTKAFPAMVFVTGVAGYIGSHTLASSSVSVN